jgi:predicted aminopeptidase
MAGSARWRWQGLAAVAVAAAVLAGCGSLPASQASTPAAQADSAAPEGLAYVAQALQGHWGVMRAARPVTDWLADDATPPALKERLATVQRMRRFAVDALDLPDNASYTRYADLKRRAVVWNVVATPEFSLRLHTWCYPVLGCVGYRGYFDETQAQALAQQLRAQGLESAVYPVPAYSTLGWTNWLGGDPLLNTMLAQPEGEVARLLFHELAHQRLYLSGDTEFNESYATAVERLGGQRWLAQAGPSAQAAYAAFDQRRTAFRALTADTREHLQEIYALALSAKDSDAIKNEELLRHQKAQVLARFRQRYAQLKAGWGGYSGYDAWVERANNATFAVQAAYDRWVPAFEALFEQHGRDFRRFHAAVADLSRQPPEQRLSRLQALQRLHGVGQVNPDGAAPGSGL